MGSERPQLAERLKKARDEAGLTQDQVADWLKVRRPAIAEIEAGKRAVKSDELVRLAELYGKSLKWLLEGEESAEERVAAALFRVGEKESPGLRREVGKLARRCRLACELEEGLALTRRQTALPRYSDDRALADFSDAMRHGFEIAHQERARLGMGTAAPVRDPWGVVEDAGLHVFPLHLGRDRDIDGIYTQLGNGRACVGVNVDKWVFRQVFTVVHEYGHAILDGDAVAQACMTSRAWTREHDVYSNRELRANQFAAVFLLPRDAIARFLGAREGHARMHFPLTPMDVVRGMDHFGVSGEMLLWRLRNEGFIDGGKRRALLDALKTLGVVATARALGYDWRSRAQPFPRIHELALKGYARGLISLGVVAELFDKPKEQMYELLRNWGIVQEFTPDDRLVGALS